MKFFDGLYPYEIVLLVLGIVLFVCLLVVLLRKPSVVLAPFFLISVVMIAYPSVRSIQYKDVVITIERKTRQVEQDPTNRSLREALKADVAKIGDRPTTNPDTSTTLARAQLTLGDERAAETNLQKSLRANPNLPAAQELKKKIELMRTLNPLTEHVEKNPDDATAKAELQKTITDVTRSSVANPETLTAIARAQAVLGDRAHALSNVDKALAINPNSDAAVRVKTNIKAMPVQPESVKQ